MTAVMEHRTYRQVPVPEVRAAEDGTPILDGYGAVFMRYSQNLGGFVEQVDPGAFDGTLQRAASGERTIALLGNHDPSWLLGTTDSEPRLDLTVDTTGLRYSQPLVMADPDALRMKAKVESRAMRGSSFSFTVLPDGAEWALTDQGFPLRTLLAVDLYDVGPVTFPAYRQTQEADVAVALRSLATYVDDDYDRVLAAAQAGELRSVLAGAPEVPHPETGDAGSNPVPSAAVRRYMRRNR